MNFALFCDVLLSAARQASANVVFMGASIRNFSLIIFAVLLHLTWMGTVPFGFVPITSETVKLIHAMQAHPSEAKQAELNAVMRRDTLNYSLFCKGIAGACLLLDGWGLYWLCTRTGRGNPA